MSENEKLVERLTRARTGYAADALPLLEQAAAALTAAEARIKMLEGALEIIRLSDWGWTGGGAEDRLQGQFGELAADTLGVPRGLSRGWPTNNGDAGKLIAARQKARALTHGASDAG